ncbi:MAG: hypothetical protein JO328_12290 [Hyphomicrobiales bacterium]|nr:hypothetical protein [Hyphomicrobiales bacterium]MBV9427123.1 hypothetical protein [Bradyrhizobiaceae bacterium]
MAAFFFGAAFFGEARFALFVAVRFALLRDADFFFAALFTDFFAFLAFLAFFAFRALAMLSSCFPVALYPTEAVGTRTRIAALSGPGLAGLLTPFRRTLP